MVYSYSRGYRIYFDGNVWRYKDNDKTLDINRPCKKCGHIPDEEGQDYCLGTIPDVSSACCGHGIKENQYP